MDNCKNIYFAGYETTAVTAAWCLMLLALHPEWQDLVRDEARQACAGAAPDFASLHKMKQVNSYDVLYIRQHSLTVACTHARTTHSTLARSCDLLSISISSPDDRTGGSCYCCCS